MAQTQRALTRDDLRKNALSVLRELIIAIEECRIEPIIVNVDNVPLEYPSDGMMVTCMSTVSAVTFTTVKDVERM